MIKIYEDQLKSNDLLLNKTIEINNVTIVVRVLFHEKNKYYSQIFLNEYVYGS